MVMAGRQSLSSSRMDRHTVPEGYTFGWNSGGSNLPEAQGGRKCFWRQVSLCPGPATPLAPLPHTRRGKQTGHRGRRQGERAGRPDRPRGQASRWQGAGGFVCVIRVPCPERDPCPMASQWPGSGRRQGNPAAGDEGPGGHRAVTQGPFPTSGHFQIHPASKPEAFRITGSFFENKKT